MKDPICTLEQIPLKNVLPGRKAPPEATKKLTKVDKAEVSMKKTDHLHPLSIRIHYSRFFLVFLVVTNHPLYNIYLYAF